MEKFVLRELDKGIITGYRWPVTDPAGAVCIIHGIGEYAGRFDRVATKLQEAGFAVFGMDLRGHGESIGKRGDCAPRDEVLEDVSALLSYAARSCPVTKLILYGHSMGGNIVLDYRRRGAFREFPAGYLIASPWIRLVRNIPTPVYYLAKTVSHVTPTMIVGASVSESNLGNPDIVMPYHDDPMIHNRISVRCAVECFDIGREYEYICRKRKIEADEKTRDIPTLFMHGGEDKICDIKGTRAVYEGLKAAGENVSFREFPDLLHELHNGGPKSDGEEAIEAMIDFFRSC